MSKEKTALIPAENRIHQTTVASGLPVVDLENWSSLGRLSHGEELFGLNDVGLTPWQRLGEFVAMAKARVRPRETSRRVLQASDSIEWVAVLDEGVQNEIQPILGQLRKFIPESTFTLRVGQKGLFDDAPDVRAPYQIQIVLGALQGQLVATREKLSLFYRQWWVDQPNELRNKISIDLET